MCVLGGGQGGAGGAQWNRREREEDVCVSEEQTNRPETDRGREERNGERERLLLESVKTIMQTDTLEMRYRLPWQQALG